jgi:hypothetical protein
MSKKDTQVQQIWDHLVNHGSITPIDALNLYGCFRLGARVWDIRNQGVAIITAFETKNGKTYARYSLDCREANPNAGRSVQEGGI